MPPPPYQKPINLARFIKDIKVISGKASPLPSDCPRPSKLVNVNLQGPRSTGPPTYLCLSQAELSAGGQFVSDVVVAAAPDDGATECPSPFYTKLPYDLNQGSTGWTVNLCVLYSGPYGFLIRELTAVYGAGAACPNSYVKDPTSLNSGIEGAVPTILCELKGGAFIVLILRLKEWSNTETCMHLTCFVIFFCLNLMCLS